MRCSLIEQHLLEASHWPRKIVLAIAVGLALTLAYKAARAETPVVDPLVLQPVKPAEEPAPPLASMGVMQCGKPVVIWVITADSHTLRFDKDHRPSTEAGVQAFLTWLGTGPEDVYTMPCPITT
jgi:hypothetical protein